MLVTEKKFQEEDGSIGYYEAIYDSSNVLKTTYFPKALRLYISFNRGGVYSYENISEELYEEFKNQESQGQFFAKTIRKNADKYPYRKEFTLYPEEVKDLKEVVEFSKNEKLEEPAFLCTVNEDNDETDIIFKIKDEEIIRLNSEGFYYKGNLVEKDKQIYKDFKFWLEEALHLID